jgi:hypothetical protein
MATESQQQQQPRMLHFLVSTNKTEFPYQVRYPASMAFVEFKVKLFFLTICGIIISLSTDQIGAGCGHIRAGHAAGAALAGRKVYGRTLW